MPGTIQVSILELAVHPSLQQSSSSMGIKVSMGKQAYDILEKDVFSFVLASLRDNLSVTIHDSEGNEIAHTGVESRSIVEKGVWDDIFPLQGGGHVHMRLHFILTEEEQKRVRSMRESALRKKNEELLKRSHSSSDLAVTSGDSLKTSHQGQDGDMNTASRRSKLSSGSSAEVPSQVPTAPKKHVFSTSKSTGALDKLPGYQRVKKEIQPRNKEQQNQLDKTPSNVRNMILSFESSPLKEASPASIKTKATTQASSMTTIDKTLKAPKKTVPVSLRSVSDVKVTEQKLIRDYVDIHQENLWGTAIEEIPLKSLQKRVFVSAEPVLPNLETVPAPVSNEIFKERQETMDYADSCQETLCSTTTALIPLELPKKMISITNLGTLPPRKSEEIVVEGAEDGNYVNASEETLVLNNEQFKELGIESVDHMSNKKKMFETQPGKAASKEEVVTQNKMNGRLTASRQSKFSWKMLSQGLPRHIADKSVPTKQFSTSFNPSLLEKNRRSKRLKSGENYVESKVSCGNKYYSSGSFRGWIFVEERIHSCVQNDDWPLINHLEGGCSNCNRDTYQEKLKETEGTADTDERSSDFRPHGSDERPESPDSKPHIRPVRQAVNIAVMVGFGLLVFLTRQRK